MNPGEWLTAYDALGTVRTEVEQEMLLADSEGHFERADTMRVDLNEKETALTHQAAEIMRGLDIIRAAARAYLYGEDEFTEDQFKDLARALGVDHADVPVITKEN